MMVIKRAAEEHLEQINEIEEQSFAIPWTKAALYKDIIENAISIYVVAVDGDVVLGYAGMWHVVTEGHITNVAVRHEYRRQGIGEMLIKSLIQYANDLQMIGLTLEVRINNHSAQRLYTKNGFKCEGIRKKYYSDTGEDALIMWKYI